jgi:acylphosphatase
MDDQPIYQLHALIEGEVQGVGFRYFAVEIARNLDLTGWVRNTYDGRVEVVAEGQRPALDQYIIALQRGPRSAVVSKVDVRWGQPSGKYDHFSMLTSAYSEF